MQSNRKFFTGFVLLAVLSVACACPASIPGLNPLKGIEETGKAIASELPEGLGETAEAYATKMDVSPQELARTAEAYATQAGISPEGIAKTAEAGIATFMPEKTGEPPEDIPMMEGEVSIQLSSPEMVSYTVKQPAEDVKNFYQGQMLAYGWKQGESTGFQIPGTTVLTYENGHSRASITIIGVGDTTQVLIEVSAK